MTCPETSDFSGWFLSGVADGSAGAAGPFFGGLAFGAMSPGLSGAVVFRAAALWAGLRVAVLLLVFVAIVLPLKFRSWLKRPQTEPLLVYNFLPVHCIVDFARLCFVDR